MLQYLLRRVLIPIIGLLERSATAPHDQPSPREEGTRFPEFPWDLRTIIIVFPPDAPFRFLNLNVLLGMTGMPFDQTERWNGSDPKDAFDLQFCLEGRNRYATYKQYHSIARELDYRPNAVQFRLGERLHFEGRWPSYQIRYNQPEENLRLTIELDSWEGFHWWAYVPRIYCHFTSFGHCRVEWQWNGDSGVLESPALHDHGWGRNLLPLRVPLKVFRYEVLLLPEGMFESSEGFAISLWTEAPGGMELKNIGLLRWDRRRSQFMDRYECQILEWDTFDNYAGQPCRVPRRWLGRLRSNGDEFSYEARRKTEPRPVLGEGFLYGFDYQGQWSGSPGKKIEGEGYVEQLGRFLR